MNCEFEEAVCLISNYHVIFDRRRGHEQEVKESSCRGGGGGGRRATHLLYQVDLRRVYPLVPWEDNHREKTVSTANRGD